MNTCNTFYDSRYKSSIIILGNLINQSVISCQCYQCRYVTLFVDLDNTRSVELTVCPAEDKLIVWKEGLSTFASFPTCLELNHTVEAFLQCVTVCHHKGSTYIGYHDRSDVGKIDQNYKLTRSFIKTSSPVDDIAVYKNHIYLLVHRGVWRPYVVEIYDLDAYNASMPRCQPVTRWVHEDISKYRCKMVIVNDQAVLPDRKEKQLVVYTLSGEKPRRISCPQMSKLRITMCAANNNSVIVANKYSSQVFLVNLEKEEVVWCADHVPGPEGLACYMNSYIFVTNNSVMTTIRVMDLSSGKC